jgi:hypothetical protein
MELSNQNLSNNQIESIRKSFLRSRVILALLLGGIMATILYGIIIEAGADNLVVTIISNLVIVAIFAAIWFRGYRNHRMIMKGLTHETYTIYEGRIEKTSSGGGTVLFKINGIEHYADSRFGKYCIKGNSVRLFKTDKSKIVFDVEDL